MFSCEMHLNFPTSMHFQELGGRKKNLSQMALKQTGNHEVAPPITVKYVRTERKEKQWIGGLDDLLSHLWSP